MKLAVLTCAVWPTMEEVKRKLWIFLASYRKFASKSYQGLFAYGVGREFPGYKTMMLDWQLEWLKQYRNSMLATYTHVLFSDGWDAMFTSNIDEIEQKYQDMGSPEFLASAFHQLGNVSDADAQYPNCFDSRVYNRYPNRGGYIGEIGAVIDAFERMVALPRQTGDDCFNWYDLWARGWSPMLDSECRIFQVSDGDCTVDTSEGGRRLLNRRTDTHPCVLHLSGGYTDQVTGKDHVMEPWARRLGIIE